MKTSSDVLLRGWMRVCLLTLFLHGAAMAAERASDAMEDASFQQKIESLIHDLGNEKFQVRERATAELEKLSEDAIPLLEKAAESDDPEVRARARRIVDRLRLGITPDWPADMVRLVEDYPRMAPAGRTQTLHTLELTLKEKAAPFLISATASRNKEEAEAALAVLRPLMDGNRTVAERTTRLLKKPATDAQRKALAWAFVCMGDIPEALQSLVGVDPKDNLRSELLEKALKELVAQQNDAQFDKVHKDAARLAEAAPTEARFLYLDAEALAALGKGKEAKDLREKALALHPKDEAPHYSAGEMLGELGRNHLATREWETILKMPPVDDVYDINAYLRLSTILSTEEHFQKAADLLEKAIALSKGKGMFMVGADEKTIQARLQWLRKQGPDQRQPMADEKKDDTDLHLNVRIEVKGGKLDELRKALKDATRVLTVNVKPLGVRILDLPNASLHYDDGKQQLLLSLNKQPADQPVPLEIKEKQARIVVHSLDCSYVFEITRESGDVKLIGRYEKNYVIQFEPRGSLDEFMGVEATINGNPYDWEDMQEGIRFDFLPEAFKIKITGTDPTPQRRSINFDLKVKDPGALPAEVDEGE